MTKVGIILANGFEEIEAITTIDILRRLDINCEMISLNSLEVTGSHGIKVICDKKLDDSIADYDVIILPGGLPGATNLKDDEYLISLIQKANNKNKYICAICAAPIVLEKAGLLKNKEYTSYPGYDNELTSGIYKEDIVVVSENIITSRGPATSFEFAYKIAQILQKDTSALEKGMLYNFLKEKGV